MFKLKMKQLIVPMTATVGPVSLWLVFFVAVPLIGVLVMSFCSIDQYYNVVLDFSLKNYGRLFDVHYMQIYIRSLFIALMTTAICLLVSFPFSFIISRTRSKYKNILYMLVIVPFWTNSLIRIYGWRLLLGTTGWINKGLLAMGIIKEPLDMLFNQGTTILGMVYCLIPFMILPLYTSLGKIDNSLLEASSDLGGKWYQTLKEVVIPLSMSGIFSGSIMVFIPTLGYFFVSDILGGGNTDMIGNLIERQFQSGNNWPLGAALSIILIAITLLLVQLYRKVGGNMEDLGA